MVTLDELKTRPTIIDLGLEGAVDDARLVHLVDPLDLEKLQYMSMKDAVQYVLNMHQTDEKKSALWINEYIKKLTETYGTDVYFIKIPGQLIQCIYDANKKKIILDERNEKVIDYFLEAETRDHEKVWVLDLTVCSPRLI